MMTNKNKGWTPDKNHHTIETFVEAVKKDIECTKTFKTKQPHPNLGKGEREAIKELSKREDIMITNADKGGAVVLVDTNDYIKEPERQLNDKDNHHIVPQDPTLGNNKLAKQAIDGFKKENLITEKFQTDLKRQIREHRASTSLPKFTNQETQVVLSLVQSTVTQLTYLITLTIIYNPS